LAWHQLPIVAQSRSLRLLFDFLAFSLSSVFVAAPLQQDKRTTAKPCPDIAHIKKWLKIYCQKLDIVSRKWLNISLFRETFERETRMLAIYGRGPHLCPFI
jgi:hypothetical protein